MRPKAGADVPSRCSRRRAIRGHWSGSCLTTCRNCRCFAACRLAPDQQQGMVEREPQPIVAPQVEPAPHRGDRRKTRRKHPPRQTPAQQVQDPLDNPPHRPLARAARRRPAEGRVLHDGERRGPHPASSRRGCRRICHEAVRSGDTGDEAPAYRPGLRSRRCPLSPPSGLSGTPPPAMA